MIDKKSRTESEGMKGGQRSGVEILVNQAYHDGPGGSGQYTKKIFHVGSHLPAAIRAVLPKTALQVHEEVIDAFGRISIF
jgi:hypothetical protein